MNILGVSFDYHDAAAALIVDGTTVAAAQEERFTRQKHDAHLPEHAIKFCLSQAGIRSVDVDYVVHYENPFLKFDRILWSAKQPGARNTETHLWSTLRSWMRNGKLEVRRRLSDHLKVSPEKVVSLQHHQSHAASAFFCSPFERSTIVTLDGVGEFETASVSLGAGLEITPLQSIRLPHSLGLLYTAFTAYLGFEVNEGEYKVMGMAGFGRPTYYVPVRKLVTLNANGTFSIDQKCFDFLSPTYAGLTDGLVALLGPSREPESSFSLNPDHPEFKDSQRFADVAASIQQVTEEVILHVVGHAVERTKVRDVCLAGGCALNSLANRRLEKELGCRLFVQPAAGDSGAALGAALYYWHAVLKQPRLGAMTHVYLGRDFSDKEIEEEFIKAKFTPAHVAVSDMDLVRYVAQLIADGGVVGWFQGRSEWGARALGSRSILADPTRSNMKKIVNEKIKFREPFRPFAPAVVVERAHEFFDLNGCGDPSAPENFMLLVCAVREKAKEQIPAVTHVDGTARVQVVRSEISPLFHALIQEFGVLTGLPVLLNTSFNLRGEPIVDSPADAIRTFSWSDMDYLVMGRYVIRKEYPM